MKLSDLLESKEKNLLDLKIEGRLVTKKTKQWDGNFFCDKLKLTSLKYCPQTINNGYFDCSGNQLTSLEHGPTSVGGDFWCKHNQLTSLEHGPTSVGGDFYCGYNKLTSLKDVHKHVKQMNGEFWVTNNPIKSHVLGLLLIKGCTSVELGNKEVQNIINKYLPNTRGHKAVAECQDELIEANLDEYAQL